MWLCNLKVGFVIWFEHMLVKTAHKNTERVMRKECIVVVYEIFWTILVMFSKKILVQRWTIHSALFAYYQFKSILKIISSVTLKVLLNQPHIVARFVERLNETTMVGYNIADENKSQADKGLASSKMVW
jgi:hypothetical protein